MSKIKFMIMAYIKIAKFKIKLRVTLIDNLIFDEAGALLIARLTLAHILCKNTV